MAAEFENIEKNDNFLMFQGLWTFAGTTEILVEIFSCAMNFSLSHDFFMTKPFRISHPNIMLDKAYMYVSLRYLEVRESPYR